MERIGKYEIQAQIGRGGFGRVYRAFDPIVGRTVAIKVLLGDGGVIDDELLSRFRVEASATGSLRHKNIITIFDYGEHEGTPYLVMEYLEGRDLQKIAAETLSLLDKVSILEQVAEGLQHAHQNGVVHRDVKPANIMILNDGSVKIMDFGIARVLREQGTRITQQGNLIGTIAYMAPEQFQGGEVDHRSDIFAYGVIFYELVSGTHPFRPQQAQTAQVIYRIGAIEPPPVASIVPGFPEALDRLIFQAIQKDREARFQSFEDIRYDIAPIREKLLAEYAGQALARAKELQEAGKLDEALAVVREVLRRDPGNQAARALREELQRVTKNKARQDQATKLTAAAKQYLAIGDFSNAIENFEGALRFDSANNEIGPLLARAKAAKVKADQVAALMDAARRELQARNFTGAYRNASECLERAPGHREASDLIASIREQVDRREREERIEGTLARAKALAVAGSYDEALALLDELIADYPDAHHLGAIAERLRARRQQDRERKLAEEIGRVRSLIGSRQWQPALASLEDLVRQNPSNSELGSLSTYVREELRAERKAEDMRGIVREAQRLCEAEDFAPAAALIDQGLQRYPRDSELERWARDIPEKRSRFERRRAIQTASRRVEELRQTRQYETALAELDAVVGKWPSVELFDLRSRIAAEWRVWQRAEEIQGRRRSIEALAGENKWREAIRAADEALVAYPDEAGLFQLRSEVEAGHRRFEVARREGEIEALIASGRFGEAIQSAESAWREFSGQGEFAALKSRAGQARFQRERDEAVTAACEEARRFRGAGDLDAAAGVLARLDEMYERDERVTILLDELGAEQLARERARLKAEAKEKAEREAREHAAAQEQARLKAEAKEKAEREAREHAAAQEQARLKAEAEEKAEREAREHAAAQEQTRLKAEAKEKAEREAREHAAAQEQARLKAEAKEKAEREAREHAAAQEQTRLKAEAKEKAEREAREHAAAQEQARLKAEAKEKAEREAREHVAAQEQARLKAEAKEKAEREAREHVAAQEQARLKAEAKEKAEREAREHAAAQEQTRLKAEAKEKAEREAREHAAAQEQARLKAEAKEKAEREAREHAAAQEQARLAAEAKEKAEREAREHAAAQEQARLKAEAKEKAEREAREHVAAQEQARLKAEAKEKAEREAREHAAAQEQTRLKAEAKEKAEREAREHVAAQEQARLKAEAKEKAEREAREHVAAQEQARLKAEAKEKAEREARELAAAREQARAAAEAKKKAEREAHELAAAQERARLEKAEREARELAAAQEQARRAAEAREKAEREAREQAAARERARLAAEAKEREAQEQETRKRSRKEEAREKATRNAERENRRQRMREILADLEAKAKSGDFEGAGATLNVALRDFKGDPTLLEKQHWLEQQRAAAAQPTKQFEAPEPPPPPKSNRMAIAAIAAVALAAVSGYIMLRGPGASGTALTVTVSPAGTSVVVGGQSCQERECRFDLPKGAYELEARLEGYRPQRLPVTIKAENPPMSVALQPMLARIRVSTNLESGRVTLDGAAKGVLQQGEFLLEESPAGKHTIEVTAPGGARVRVNFESQPGRAPVVLGPVEAGDLRALAFSQLGRQGAVSGDGKPQTISLDNSKIGQPGASPLVVENLSSGNHELVVEDGQRSLRLPVKQSSEPALTVFVRANRDAGLLVVDAQEAEANVLVNGRVAGRTASNGVFQATLPVGEYRVSVEKPGFSPSAPATVRIARDSVQQIAARLEGKPAEVTIADALAGTQVFADGRLLGSTATPSSTFSLPAGLHNFELKKDGHTSKQFALRLEPGGRTAISGRDAQLSRVAEPSKPASKQPDPVPVPDAASAEARRFAQVEYSRDVAALEQFLRDYPRGSHTDAVTGRIEQIEWDAARGRADAASIKAFLARHPRGSHRDEAESLLGQLEKDRIARQRAEADRLAQAERDRTDAQAVAQTLNRLSAAYGSKDANEISALYPSVSRQFLTSLRRDIQSLTMQFRNVSAPQVNGDTAVLQADREVATLFKGESKPKTESDHVTVTLRRTPAGWVIDSVR